MSRFDRMKSGLAKAKNLKSQIKKKASEVVAGSSDAAEMKTSSPRQPPMDFTGMETDDLIDLLTKECDNRMRITDELDGLRDELDVETWATSEADLDQPSQNDVNSPRSDKNENSFKSELDKCRKEMAEFKALYLSLKNEHEKRSSEIAMLKKKNIETLTLNEALRMEVVINKGNYQKVQEMLSDDARLEKVQYENVKRTHEELKQCREELAELKQQQESSEVIRKQYEEQLEQHEAQLNDAKVKFKEMNETMNEQISEANSRGDKLDEMLKVSREDLEKKQAEVDCISKEMLQAKEDFETRQNQIEEEHEENIKRLEKGFSTTLQAKDEEIENLQIIGNKYRKKNESLKKDVQSLLRKLEASNNQRKMSVCSIASSPGPDSDQIPQTALTITSNTTDDNDSVASLPISLTESKLKLKTKFDRAKKWTKQRNMKKVADILPDILQNRSGRCVAIEKLTRSQLEAKCNTLQLLAGELTLQVDTQNEQVQNLKFASTYLGKRVLALESTLDLMPGEEIPKNIGSRITDLRAVIEAEKQENAENKSVGEKLSERENMGQKPSGRLNSRFIHDYDLKEANRNQRPAGSLNSRFNHDHDYKEALDS